MKACCNSHSDSGSIKYTISKLTRQARETFTIGEDSGRITTTSPLDREVEQFYNFVVEATDELGRQGMASIEVGGVGGGFIICCIGWRIHKLCLTIRTSEPFRGF